MKLFITGATGLVGRRLVEDRLRRGDQVVALSRDGARARALLGGDGAGGLLVVEGDPTTPGDWQERLGGLDAVIHLAGAGVAARRWTKQYKKTLVRSRTESTRLITSALEAAPERPRTFICASAIGYYGERGDTPTDETAPAGTDFLARLAVEWEAQARAAEALSVRVVRLRIGVVLDPDGGALPKMAMPFRLLAGGPIGSGRQHLSWIHWRDLLGIIDLALRDPRADGAFNATSPQPVTNRVFARTLGRVLRRPSWLVTPRFALRIVLGELATYATMSQRIMPRRAQEHGYGFQYPDLEAALAHCLRRNPK